MDDCHGGAAVYQITEGMAGRLKDAVRRGSYVPSVGQELQKVTAATMEHAGWLADDAGWQHKARHRWLETCHLADVADVSGLRVTTLASMALQASDAPPGNRATVDLVQAARRAAAHDQEHRLLLSLFAAREAIGHAQTGDHGATISAMGEARRWLDQGRQGDEPFWLDFWGPADLASEIAARSALAGVDATLFPRNHISYTVQLGSVLAQRGQLDEAISVTSEAVQKIHATQGSGRAVAKLHRVVDLLR